MGTTSYHHGLTIREYREKAKMTQQQLANRWPKSERFGGGEGVSLTYIQDIEHGRKKVDDIQTLRKLCDLLNIPYWKVGLSEYDPFTGTLGRGKHFITETLSLIEISLRQVWVLRQASLFPQATKALAQLGSLFSYFQTEYAPPLRLEEKFLHLCADFACVNGVFAVDNKQYALAISHYETMYAIAKQLDSSPLLAHALMNLGVEYDRGGDFENAVDALEQARDYSFEAAKPWSVLIHSYLSRVYASVGDVTRFGRANDTARRLSSHLQPNFHEDEEAIFYTQSNILAERSYGYLSLNQPEQTLAMRDEITKQLLLDRDNRLQAWICLDWAKAYQMLGEIEACIKELRKFYQRCSLMQSPHALSQVNKVVASLEKQGYGDVSVMRDFKEEIQT